MNWKVVASKKVTKQVQKLAPKIRDVLETLVRDIRVSGPVRGDWPNYSKLSDGSHHCHLDYRHVACWREESGEVRLVEVYYVGSRKDAPYD
jgi:mRNA-degrading endonuclease RelE of RelBE toxin-antitoxin system